MEASGHLGLSASSVDVTVPYSRLHATACKNGARQAMHANGEMSVPKSEATQCPVLLLKTKSVPTDHYEELFSREDSGFRPSFLPVLEHQFKKDTISWLNSVVLGHGFACHKNDHVEVSAFGGLIFTSQRAVEAFASIVEAIESERRDVLLPEDLPLYVVGPATARGIRSLGLRCQVLGEEAGNGEALSHFVIDHYNSLPNTQTAPHGHKLPLLFLVGEQRRDIIPRTLQSQTLQESERIGVDEHVVYETGEMETFHLDFSRSIAEHERSGEQNQWVVVFSPQGCKAMLRCLGWLDESTGRYDPELNIPRALSTHIATIGPTTRNYLIEEFSFEPHISAERPSAEGILSAIRAYQSS